MGIMGHSIKTTAPCNEAREPTWLTSPELQSTPGNQTTFMVRTKRYTGIFTPGIFVGQQNEDRTPVPYTCRIRGWPDKRDGGPRERTHGRYYRCSAKQMANRRRNQSHPGYSTLGEKCTRFFKTFTTVNEEARSANEDMVYRSSLSLPHYLEGSVFLVRSRSKETDSGEHRDIGFKPLS